MNAGNLVNAILNKCNIYYNKCLISKEKILKEYLSFFSESLVSKERTVNFAMHTGSVCFDIISLVAVALGCLSYNISTNDDIIAALEIDDMVMFKGERYKWKGTEMFQDGILRMQLLQEAKGKNGESTLWCPYETNKHLIRPYYGLAKDTGGKGVRKKSNERENFLATIFDCEVSEVPVQIDVSIVIVCPKEKFTDIFKNIKIVYGDKKGITLEDIVPTAYYTSSGEMHQIGNNQTKAEPVLKVVHKISTARDLVLDRQSNKVVGLLVMNDEVGNISENSDLADLLRRQILRFVHVVSPINSEFRRFIVDNHPEAHVFVCSKKHLEDRQYSVSVPNLYTKNLYAQLENIQNSRVFNTDLDFGYSKEEYRMLRDMLWSVKQSSLSQEVKEEFVVSSYGLMNLFNTSIFSMDAMEKAIANKQINPSVTSPKARLDKLKELSMSLFAPNDVCLTIIELLEKKYEEFYYETPKEKNLIYIVGTNRNKKITVVVPKAYYVDLFKIAYPEYFVNGNMKCVVANRYNSTESCDMLIVVGDLKNKNFDPFLSLQAKEVNVLLYESEKSTYRSKQKKHYEYDKKINAIVNHEYWDEPELTSSIPCAEQDYDEVPADDIDDLDEYIESIRSASSYKFVANNSSSSNTSGSLEVKYMGIFDSGEAIYFSRYYSAVVYDKENGTVDEKSAQDLKVGDSLVFIRKNDFSGNIVDYLYECLMNAGIFGKDEYSVYEESMYWKKVLKKYRENMGLSYREVSDRLRRSGSNLQDNSIRRWFVEDDRTIGPRDKKTLDHIAVMTQDTYLLKNSQSVFEACRRVKHNRREILKLMKLAINNILSGNPPEAGSELSIIYDNIEDLADIVELIHISEMDEKRYFSLNLVNRPINVTEG